MASENFEKEIKKLDKNLELLLGECLDNDMSEEKVYKLINESVCKKVSKKISRTNRSRILISFLKCLVITLILSYLLTKKPITTDVLKMMGRKMLINIKPFYDWTEYYDTRCFVKNEEYSKERGLSGDLPNCNLCENVINFEMINNSNELENRLTELIDNLKPIIIQTNRLSNIDHNPIFNLTLNQLADLYLSFDFKDKVCMFESNLNFGNVFNLMSKVSSGSLLPFFAQWENCGYATRKKIRTLYEVPEFLPMMLEFTKENWFLFSSNYTSENFKKIDIAPGTKLAVLIQLNGSNRIQLKPKKDCSPTCNEIEQIIYERDLVIFSTALFDVFYLPNSNTKLNLAFLLGANY